MRHARLEAELAELEHDIAAGVAHRVRVCAITGRRGWGWGGGRIPCRTLERNECGVPAIRTGSWAHAGTTPTHHDSLSPPPPRRRRTWRACIGRWRRHLRRRVRTPPQRRARRRSRITSPSLRLRLRLRRHRRLLIDPLGGRRARRRRARRRCGGAAVWRARPSFTRAVPCHTSRARRRLVPARRRHGGCMRRRSCLRCGRAAACPPFAPRCPAATRCKKCRATFSGRGRRLSACCRSGRPHPRPQRRARRRAPANGRRRQSAMRSWTGVAPTCSGSGSDCLRSGGRRRSGAGPPLPLRRRRRRRRRPQPRTGPRSRSGESRRPRSVAGAGPQWGSRLSPVAPRRRAQEERRRRELRETLGSQLREEVQVGGAERALEQHSREVRAVGGSGAGVAGVLTTRGVLACVGGVAAGDPAQQAAACGPPAAGAHGDRGRGAGPPACAGRRVPALAAWASHARPAPADPTCS